MLGGNKTVIDSSTVPHAKLLKRHKTVPFQQVCEAVASDMVAMHYICGVTLLTFYASIGATIRYGAYSSLSSFSRRHGSPLQDNVTRA